MIKKIWILWVIIICSVIGFYSYKIFYAEDKSELLIGEATHGHFQIELACDSCHTSAFGGDDVLQNACVNCHGDDLEASHDSHPKKKFTNPRNADLLKILDARYCVSCHKEHQNEQTHPMGVSLPEDYCYHCHQNVLEDRESHKDLAFDSCATSGCHNYHDNRALYHSFLVDNAGGSWLNAIAEIPQRKAPPINDLATKILADAQITISAPDYPDGHEDWPSTVHGKAGIACTSCHVDLEAKKNNEDLVWLAKPKIENCQSCHKDEAATYLEGKHGMRLAVGLSGITPSQSSMVFHNDAMQMEQSCNACHSAHSFDTKEASVASCLSCHNDEHSKNFLSSPHGMLDSGDYASQNDTSVTVTCATCHLPRIKKKVQGEEFVFVNHNQNHYLRPNEKMIRPVCLNCHNLAFSIDALADEALIKNNFNGQPQKHIPSIDWALEDQ